MYSPLCKIINIINLSVGAYLSCTLSSYTPDPVQPPHGAFITSTRGELQKQHSFMTAAQCNVFNLHCSYPKEADLRLLTVEKVSVCHQRIKRKAESQVWNRHHCDAHRHIRLGLAMFAKHLLNSSVVIHWSDIQEPSVNTDVNFPSMTDHFAFCTDFKQHQLTVCVPATVETMNYSYFLWKGVPGMCVLTQLV